MLGVVGKGSPSSPGLKKYSSLLMAKSVDLAVARIVSTHQWSGRTIYAVIKETVRCFKRGKIMLARCEEWCSTRINSRTSSLPYLC